VAIILRSNKWRQLNGASGSAAPRVLRRTMMLLLAGLTDGDGRLADPGGWSHTPGARGLHSGCRLAGRRTEGNLLWKPHVGVAEGILLLCLGNLDFRVPYFRRFFFLSFFFAGML